MKSCTMSFICLECSFNLTLGWNAACGIWNAGTPDNCFCFPSGTLFCNPLNATDLCLALALSRAFSRIIPGSYFTPEEPLK